MEDLESQKLLAAGRSLEAMTMAWNVAGVIVLALTALKAHSVALGGFGLDSAVEIAASALVLHELRGAIQPKKNERSSSLAGPSLCWLSTSQRRARSCSSQECTQITVRWGWRGPV